MAQLAIKGHPTRGKEVIEILEMLGGINSHNLYGDENYAYYTIDGDKEIKSGIYIFGDEQLCHFTIEEFLEEFPYKVGDKVIYEGKRRKITNMVWEEQTDTVAYKLDDKLYCNVIDELQPYKEEITKGKDYSPIILLPVLDKVMIIPTDEESEIVQENNKFYLVKKQSQYPKTYEECCKVLNLGEDGKLYTKGYKARLIQGFQKLLICRDAYWKIAGEQMGLGKPWKPDLENKALDCIQNYNKQIIKNMTTMAFNRILTFPTKEIRDAFYENFKELIEQCKELL